jgi:hypothetical protein
MENAWMDEQAKCGALEADNAALREQADVDRSFIEQYQREVAAGQLMLERSFIATLREGVERAERAIDYALDFIAVNNWAGAHDVLYETRYPRPDTKASTTADQRDKGPCWAGGNIAGE